MKGRVRTGFGAAGAAGVSDGPRWGGRAHVWRRHTFLQRAPLASSFAVEKRHKLPSLAMKSGKMKTMT